MQWTDKAIEVVKNRYPTEGAVKLAKELGMTAEAVTAKARRLGLASTRKRPPKGFVWTKAMDLAIKERYVKEGAQPLAAAWGIGIDTVRRRASSMGLHTIAGHKRWGEERAAKSKSCDIHYFDTWSPSMAYVLGFLFADGSIDRQKTSLWVNLTRKDESVLHFIRKELKAVAPVRRKDAYVTKDGTSVKPLSSLVVCSTVLCRRLMSLGMMPRKTFRNDPFPIVPDTVMPDFIRGYFDGDGSVSVYQSGNSDCCAVSFVGSPNLITGIRDSLAKLAKMRTAAVRITEGKTADWASVCWSNLEDVWLFRKYIYPPKVGFCLKRKHAKLNKWFSKPRRFWNLPTE